MKYFVREDYTIKESLSSYEDVLNNTYLISIDNIYQLGLVEEEFMELTYNLEWYYVYVDNGNVLTTLTEIDLQKFGKAVEQFEKEYAPKLLDIDDEFYESEISEHDFIGSSFFKEFKELMDDYTLSCINKYRKIHYNEIDRKET